MEKHKGASAPVAVVREIVNRHTVCLSLSAFRRNNEGIDDHGADILVRRNVIE
jgi:hypothetical protein